MRGLLTATAVWLAWPEDGPPRGWASAVAVAASDVSLYWFLIGEVVPLVFLC